MTYHCTSYKVNYSELEKSLKCDIITVGIYMDSKAYLSNEGQYTIFSFGSNRLKFIAPYSLERYESVVTWDNGYLVVMAKYVHNKTAEEEYIDLIPILKSLYIKPEDFLKPIKTVEVRYE